MLGVDGVDQQEWTWKIFFKREDAPGSSVCLSIGVGGGAGGGAAPVWEPRLCEVQSPGGW